MDKINVYVDSGASLPKDLQGICECYQFPYDSAHRPKKRIPKLANPSELTWKEWNCSWNESEFTWEDSGLAVPEKIKLIVGKHNERDCKHLASALRMGCQAFLTSDKRDLSAKRKELNDEFGIRVFHLPFEEAYLRVYLQEKALENGIC